MTSIEPHLLCGNPRCVWQQCIKTRWTIQGEVVQGSNAQLVGNAFDVAHLVFTHLAQNELLTFAGNNSVSSHGLLKPSGLHCAGHGIHLYLTATTVATTGKLVGHSCHRCHLGTRQWAVCNEVSDLDLEF